MFRKNILRAKFFISSSLFYIRSRLSLSSHIQVFPYLSTLSWDSWFYRRNLNCQSSSLLLCFLWFLFCIFRDTRRVERAWVTKKIYDIKYRDSLGRMLSIFEKEISWIKFSLVFVKKKAENIPTECESCVYISIFAISMLCVVFSVFHRIVLGKKTAAK